MAFERLTREDFDEFDDVASVECDRYCASCGYNLVHQPIRREPRTGLLLVHCPECGDFESARDASLGGRTWMRRLGLVGLLVWIAILVGLQISVVLAMGTIEAITLDELTHWEPVPPELARDYPQYANYARIMLVDTSDPLRFWMPWTMSVALTLIALLFGMILAGALPHWRRSALIAWSVVWPTLVAAPVVISYWYKWPHLATWATSMAGRYVLAAVIGGVIAAFVGNAMLRGLVRILLPPRLREPFGYLWTTAGLTPPTSDRSLR